MHFMCYEGGMTTDVFKDFMTGLMHAVPGKTFLIVDNLKVHHANCLQERLEQNKGKIELRFLPSYSPELNPDEYLNRDVKAFLAERKRPSTAKAMNETVSAHLLSRKKRTRVN